MSRPDWLDPELYPFEPHYLEVDGARMHYVDEGEGPVVLMVHGTPTWSFLYRHVIRALSADHRVVAPDNLGFGLSDKPAGRAYSPEFHAQNLARLIRALDLHDFTMVVHDFGGPIGLAYAARHPEDVRALVLFNTWMWSLRGTPAERVGRIVGGPLGKLLYTRFNFSPRVIIPAAYGDKSKLTKDIHRHYTAPFSRPAERMAPWILARELLASAEWYDGLWAQRARLAEVPALILWGMKDPAFKPDALDRWRTALSEARVVEFREAGHFVQEEAPEATIREIRKFLATVERRRSRGSGNP